MRSEYTRTINRVNMGYTFFYNRASSFKIKHRIFY